MNLQATTDFRRTILEGYRTNQRQLKPLLTGASVDAGTALIRDVLAPIQAALDTIQAQTTAPRPSRRVVLWGLRQVNGVPSGVLSTIGVEHLQTLLHAIGH
jgi:hypothetical protein